MEIGPIRDHWNKGNLWFYLGISKRGIAFDLYLFGHGLNFEIRLPNLFLVGGTINFINMGVFTRFSQFMAKGEKS